MSDELTGGVLPAGNGQATSATVADGSDIERDKRRADYRKREHPKYVRALDRHIAHVYGPEYVRRWAA